MNEMNRVHSPQSIDFWKFITRTDKPRKGYPVYEF